MNNYSYIFIYLFKNTQFSMYFYYLNIVEINKLSINFNQYYFL